jgi:uncharacterized protein YjiK
VTQAVRRSFRAAAAVVAMVGTALACGVRSGRGVEHEMAIRQSRLAAALRQSRGQAAVATFLDRPLARWLLPGALAEISGLALTDDGRLLAHGDERAVVSEIDPRRGVLVKSFTLGERPVKGDFESIAMVGERLFLLTSKGKLYESREGGNGASMPYKETDTHLGKDCEFEAMTWDPGAKRLLLACKHVHRKRLKRDDAVVLIRIPLPGASGDTTLSEIPLTEFTGPLGTHGFHPSDIARVPMNGDFLLVAGIERALAEITPDGRVVWAHALVAARHPQPEGVVVTRDSTIIVSDEAHGGTAAVTVYAYPTAP